MLHITVITLFPDMFVGPFDQSIIKRALTNKLVTIKYLNLRDFATDAYKSVDDHPYGGGHGMILRADIVYRAILAAKQLHNKDKTRTILLDPQGEKYTQTIAKTFTIFEHLIFVCAHYEGIDERIRSLVDQEISIGDYVLTGGELPAMVVIDSVIRLTQGVLKDPNATRDESFTENLLEYPQYTRPETVNGQTVPSILLSGNHKEIATWRKTESLDRTKKRRPDLLTKE